MLRNVKYTVLERRPPVNDEDGGSEQVTLLQLDDGMVIELCSWGWDGMCMIDVGVDQKAYDAVQTIPFEEYMRGKGMLLQNVPIDDEDYWEYSGPLKHHGQYRLQYTAHWKW